MNKNKITIKADFEKIERATGIKFEDMEQLTDHIQLNIELLKANNKNYTKQQNNIVNDLFYILQSITIENKRTKEIAISEIIKNELMAFQPIINIPFESFEEVGNAIEQLGYRKESDVVKEILLRLSKYNVNYNADLQRELNRIVEEYGTED